MNQLIEIIIDILTKDKQTIKELREINVVLWEYISENDVPEIDKRLETI